MDRSAFSHSLRKKISILLICTMPNQRSATPCAVPLKGVWSSTIMAAAGLATALPPIGIRAAPYIICLGILAWAETTPMPLATATTDVYKRQGFCLFRLHGVWFWALHPHQKIIGGNGKVSAHRHDLFHIRRALRAFPFGYCLPRHPQRFRQLFLGKSLFLSQMLYSLCQIHLIPPFAPCYQIKRLPCYPLPLVFCQPPVAFMPRA